MNTEREQSSNMDNRQSGDPLFSIVVPTYNREDSILNTIKGCLAQSLADFELVIVDDGSEDDTAVAVRAVEDNRIRYIYQENSGPAAARNAGVKAASGKYIAYLDADDQWYPEYLETAHDFIQTGNHRFVYSQIIVDRGVGRYWVKPDRQIEATESIFDYLYIHGGFIQTSTMIVEAGLAQQVSWDEAVTFGDNDQYAIDLVLAGAQPVMMDIRGTLYEDIMNPKALSQLLVYGGDSEKYTNFLSWMAKQRKHMSDEAWLGFRAKFESGTLDTSARIALLREAKRAGVISSKGFLRLLLQHSCPRFYRRLTDKFVAMRGQTLQAIRP